MESVYVQRIMMNTENWLIKGVRIIRVWLYSLNSLIWPKYAIFSWISWGQINGWFKHSSSMECVQQIDATHLWPT